jgi:hypothetical protein
MPRHLISDELAQKVVVALNCALSLALMAGSPMHASLMKVANEFDDALSEDPNVCKSCGMVWYNCLCGHIE